MQEQEQEPEQVTHQVMAGSEVIRDRDVAAYGAHLVKAVCDVFLENDPGIGWNVELRETAVHRCFCMRFECLINLCFCIKIS